MGLLPKPLVEVGGRPILWHVMQRYASYGFREFILCLGFGGATIRDYLHSNSSGLPKDWVIECAQTGLHTHTGGRIKRVELLVKEDLFFATYADGVADIDLERLLKFHRTHGRIGTMTTVNPVSQFGEVILQEDGRVTQFVEKPKLNRWINGGFFIFQRDFFRYLQENSVLEKEPLERLAQEGQLYSFKHTGFWCCMDTYKDTVTLNELCRKGPPPWVRKEA